MAREYIRPIKTGDRQVDAFNRETILAVNNLYAQVGSDTTSRLMPGDAYTRHWWPCEDYTSSSTQLADVGLDASPSSALNTASSVDANAVASPTPIGRGVARVYGTPGGFTGNAAGTMSNVQTASISFWARIGDVVTDRYVFGYFDVIGPTPIFTMSIESQRPRFYVRTSAGLRDIHLPLDMVIAPSEWHHFLCTYTGTDLYVYVDGIATSSPVFASSPINWTFGGPSRDWRIGYPGSASSLLGSIKDIRVHNCARPASWAVEAWERGMGLFNG